MTHPFFTGTRFPRVFAHRGLVTAEGENSGVWENSAAAFAAADAAGIEYIETDCQVTADGDVVLFHDATIERLAGDPRAVNSVSTRDLRAMFEDHGGLLTVEEALDGFPEARFNIDVKTATAIDSLGPTLREHTHRVLLASFSDRVRRDAVASVLRSGARMRPAVSAGSATIALIRALTALHLSPARALADIDALQIPEKQGPVKVLTPALLDAAHKHDTEVHVWTINDPADMQRLVASGVDGVVSDRADLAYEVLHPQ
ncbi:glycerophosphodiester phosphodiesterase family protein [Microbacterium sp. NPDC076768]|uniref:glycerophosphodiester phosphodiesterase family protein n=1 Tax=Microbacterium sp. NPDC076768 TaxID=3154858 RepID=UPI00341394AD